MISGLTKVSSPTRILNCMACRFIKINSSPYPNLGANNPSFIYSSAESMLSASLRSSSLERI